MLWGILFCIHFIVPFVITLTMFILSRAHFPGMKLKTNVFGPACNLNGCFSFILIYLYKYFFHPFPEIVRVFTYYLNMLWFWSLLLNVFVCLHVLFWWWCRRVFTFFVALWCSCWIQAFWSAVWFYVHPCYSVDILLVLCLRKVYIQRDVIIYSLWCWFYCDCSALVLMEPTIQNTYIPALLLFLYICFEHQWFRI